MVKNPSANAEVLKFDPWVRKIPWRRKQKPTPVFLLEKSHGQRNLAGYSPQGHKESEPTEHKHPSETVIWSFLKNGPETCIFNKCDMDFDACSLLISF